MSPVEVELRRLIRERVHKASMATWAGIYPPERRKEMIQENHKAMRELSAFITALKLEGDSQ